MGGALQWLCCIFPKLDKSKKRITRSSKYIRQKRDNDNALVGEMIERQNLCGDECIARSSYDGYAMSDYPHADAVASASAKAAVVAAQAAVEVARLTTSGRFSFDLPSRAAVAIQSAFRGLLARKALRALKSLVKLQALVRGYIVRKQAAEHMRRMHSLLKAQAYARAIRASAPASSYSSPQTTHSSMIDTETTENTAKIVKADSASSVKRFISAKDSYKYQKLALYSSDDLNSQFFPKEIHQNYFYTADSSTWFETGAYKRSSSTRRRRYQKSHSSNTYQEPPNYMGYTKSAEAKLRSLSAPKQRTQTDRSALLKSLSAKDSTRRVYSPLLKQTD